MSHRRTYSFLWLRSYGCSGYVYIFLLPKSTFFFVFYFPISLFIVIMVTLSCLAAVYAALIVIPCTEARIISRSSEAPACADFTPFAYAGCFQDPSFPRALPYSDQSMNTQNMTVEYCTAWCKGNGYRYAGYYLMIVYRT